MEHPATPIWLLSVQHDVTAAQSIRALRHAPMGLSASRAVSSECCALTHHPCLCQQGSTPLIPPSQLKAPLCPGLYLSFQVY